MDLESYEHLQGFEFLLCFRYLPLGLVIGVFKVT